jgi:small-conductance mechanosensitive channel
LKLFANINNETNKMANNKKNYKNKKIDNDNIGLLSLYIYLLLVLILVIFLFTESISLIYYLYSSIYQIKDTTTFVSMFSLLSINILSIAGYIVFLGLASAMSCRRY